MFVLQQFQMSPKFGLAVTNHIPLIGYLICLQHKRKFMTAVSEILLMGKNIFFEQFILSTAIIALVVVNCLFDIYFN